MRVRCESERESERRVHELEYQIKLYEAEIALFRELEQALATEKAWTASLAADSRAQQTQLDEIATAIGISKRINGVGRSDATPLSVLVRSALGNTHRCRCCDDPADDPASTDGLCDDCRLSGCHEWRPFPDEHLRWQRGPACPAGAVDRLEVRIRELERAVLERDALMAAILATVDQQRVDFSTDGLGGYAYAVSVALNKARRVADVAPWLLLLDAAARLRDGTMEHRCHMKKPCAACDLRDALDDIRAKRKIVLDTKGGQR